MKNILLVLFLSIFSTSLLANNGSGYCNFRGAITDPEITQEEQFAMLLEREGYPNFQAMAQTVAALITVPIIDLNNPNCPVYSYSRALLAYYDVNKDKIAKNKPYIAKMINIIREKIEEKK